VLVKCFNISNINPFTVHAEYIRRALNVPEPCMPSILGIHHTRCLAAHYGRYSLTVHPEYIRRCCCCTGIVRGVIGHGCSINCPITPPNKPSSNEVKLVREQPNFRRRAGSNVHYIVHCFRRFRRKMAKRGLSADEIQRLLDASDSGESDSEFDDSDDASSSSSDGNGPADSDDSDATVDVTFRAWCHQVLGKMHQHVAAKCVVHTVVTTARKSDESPDTCVQTVT